MDSQLGKEHPPRQGQLGLVFPSVQSHQDLRVLSEINTKIFDSVRCWLIVGTYAWSRMWENIWMNANKGRLYKDCPYVYPAEE